MVEVLICLATVGLVFASAYSLARRSTIDIMTAQERVHALKLAETQVERIRADAPNRAGLFCYEQSGNINTTGTFTSGAGDANLANDTLTGYPPTCNQDSLYFIAIKGAASGSPRQYDVTVRWFRLGGDKNQVTLSYLYGD